VALKVPNPGVLDTPARVQRFLREAKAAANLRHPHIVPVHDAGKDGDRHYIAAAFVDGKPLADAVPDDGGLPFERATRLARELAEALAYAHGEGIVHRDVKPANCMLDSQDRLHLMDFGLAGRQDEGSRLTTDGSVMGTPAYMAPEQAAGRTAEVGPASDQYACGVVLYELLTGRTPFSGPVPVVIHNQIHTEPDPPSRHRPDVPKDLETVCLKAMAKRPEDRYPDCQALADDLRRWTEGEPITARRLSAVERLSRWARKNRTVAALTGALAAALVIGAAVSLGFAVVAGTQARRAERAASDARAEQQRADQERQKADGERKEAETQRGIAATRAEEAQASFKKSEAERKRADEEREKAEAARQQAFAEQKRTAEEKKRADEALVKLTEEERVARRSVYQARMQLAQVAWRESRLDLIASNLEKSIPAEGGEDLREFEWHYWQHLLNKGSQTFQIKSHKEGRHAVSPDGRWICFAQSTEKGGSHLSVIDTNDLRARPLERSSASSVSNIPPRFDSRGEKVFLVGYGQVTAWDTHTGKKLWDAPLKQGPNNPKSAESISMVVSPDGNRVYVATKPPDFKGGRGPIRVFRAKDGQEEQPYPADPQGKSVYTLLGFVKIGLQDVLIGDTSGSGGVSDFSGFGEFVQFFPTGETRPYKLPFDPPKATKPNQRSPWEGWDYRSSVRGTELILQKRAKSLLEPEEFMLFRLGDQKPKFVGRQPKGMTVYRFDFDPESGIAIGWWGKTIQVWDLNTNKIIHTLDGHLQSCTNAVYIPQSKQVFSIALDGSRLWDLGAAKTSDGRIEVHRRFKFPDPDRAIADHRYYSQLLESGNTYIYRYFKPDPERRVNGIDEQEEILAIDATSGKSVPWGRYRCVNLRQVVPAFSDDGEWMVYRVGTKFTLRELATGKEQTVEVNHQIADVQVSPSGRWVFANLVEKQKPLPPRIWDRTTGKITDLAEIGITTGNNFQSTFIAVFDPTEQRLLVGRQAWGNTSKGYYWGDGWRPVDLQEMRAGAWKGVSPKIPVFHPNGKTVYGPIKDSKQLVAMDVATGEIVRSKSLEYEESPDFTYGPKGMIAVSPDGRRLVQSGGNGTLAVLDAESLEELLLLKSPVQLQLVRFTPDSRRIVGLGYGIDTSKGESTLEIVSWGD
jgi:WD40 repeat protein